MRDWHFITCIAILSVFIYVYGKADRSESFPKKSECCLSELDHTSFHDSIANGVCFVLFYVDNSNACDKEMFHLNQIARKNGQKASFFKVNVEKYPKCGSYCNISGVPSVLIFKDGKEQRRILGVVSKRNIEIIYNRYAKL